MIIVLQKPTMMNQTANRLIQ